jgi:hypothetical protein
MAKYIDAHPEKLKMPHSEFDALMAERLKRRQAPPAPSGPPAP